MFYDRDIRTVLFGGYNKEDVRHYIDALENTAETTKFGYESEIAQLKSTIQKVQKEKEDLEEILRQHDLDDEKEAEDEPESSKSKDINMTEFYEELTEQKRENEDLKQQIVGLEAENFLLSEDKKRLERELEETKRNATNIERNDSLENEIEQLKEKKEKYEEDYLAITKVLEDARSSARYIEEEAKKKAEEMLAQARQQSTDIVEYRKCQIDKELEDKGIRLMAAKYKIETYRKEINSTQQKLYTLYSDMGKLVEGMPQSLEQLWNETAYPDIVEETSNVKRTENEKTDI